MQNKLLSMHTVVADNGLLPCVELTIVDHVIAGSDADDPEPVCWREGVQHRNSRLNILKQARLQNVSLISLSLHLGVRWSHFLEWAEEADEDVVIIFTNHRWHDEITSTAPEFVRLRRDDLAVGDYFSAA